jgi:hypothetical protein
MDSVQSLEPGAFPGEPGVTLIVYRNMKSPRFLTLNFSHTVILYIYRDPIVEIYIKADQKILMNGLPSNLLVALMIVPLSQVNNNVPIVNAAENLDRFWSILTADQQTPPVTTDAIGYVGLNSKMIGLSLCIVFMQNISEK